MNFLGFLLSFKAADGLSQNKQLLYGLLGAQAPEGNLTQALVPTLLAKREVRRKEESPPPSSPPQTTPSGEELSLRLEQLIELTLKELERQQEAEERQEKLEKLEDCLRQLAEQWQEDGSCVPTGDGSLEVENN